MGKLRVSECSHFMALAQFFSLSACVLHSLAFAMAEFFRLCFVPLRYRAPSAKGVRFFEGTVRHFRSKPVHRSFTHKVRYCLIDLDLVQDSRFIAGERMSADDARK